MLKLIWKRISSFRYISVPLFLMRPTTKITKFPTRENFELNEKKFWAHEIPTRKNFGSTKYSENIWDTNYLWENILDPRNTHRKIFWTHEKIFWTHEIPMRKYFGPTKYLRRHNGTMALDPRNLAHSCLYKEQTLYILSPSPFHQIFLEFDSYFCSLFTCHFRKPPT